MLKSVKLSEVSPSVEVVVAVVVVVVVVVVVIVIVEEEEGEEEEEEHSLWNLQAKNIRTRVTRLR